MHAVVKAWNVCAPGDQQAVLIGIDQVSVRAEGSMKAYCAPSIHSATARWVELFVFGKS